jgi:DNA-binding MarR family transcriptional regulator
MASTGTAVKKSFKQKTSEEPRAKLLTDHVADRVLRLADAMILLSAQSIKKRWGLRHTDLRLLNLLDGEKALSVREISRRAHVDQAWVSRSLRQLEEQDFVQRGSDKRDSRLAMISLTRHGRKTLDEVRPYARRSEGLLLKSINESQLKALLNTLEKNASAMLDALARSRDHDL